MAFKVNKKKHVHINKHKFIQGNKKMEVKNVHVKLNCLE